MSAAELEWRIRESFVHYVEALPDGVVAVGDDVRRRDGAFVMRGRLDETVADFAGTVRFSGHSGVLDVAMDGVTLRGIAGQAGVWTSVGGYPLELAVVGEVRAADDGLRADAVALTADGAALLGGVYQAGTALAPLIIRPVRDDERGI